MVGYSKEISCIQHLEDKYLCTCCHLILNRPMQTRCGHRYCESCIDEILRSPGEHACMICKENPSDEPQSLIASDRVFTDKAMKRELCELNVKCIIPGCTWKGKFMHYEAHRSTCPHEVMVCHHRDCNKRVRRRSITKHCEKECLMRNVECKHCKETMTYKNLTTHGRNCRRFPLDCKFCKKKNIPREEMDNHTDAVQGDCIRKMTSCIYADLGCKERVEVEKMKEHISTNTHHHLDLLRLTILEINDNINKFTFHQNIPNLKRMTTEHQTKLEATEKLVKELANQFDSHRTERVHPGTHLNMGGHEVDFERLTSSIEELKNKTSVLNTKVTTYEGIVAVLNSQIERDAQVVQTLERQRRQDKELLEALERKIKTQDRIIALKDIALAEQDIRIQSLELASYDGVLVWKISNFNRKRQDALSGRTTSIYSPCFYTSRHGYKMCARIYINGDGMGKGNHVSLFFVIMKGPFDALLRWPFRQKVTFMLLDQNNREHVIDAFRPDPTSTSFKRPANDMNVASGCPLFMPISQLDSSRHAYVKDDVMFVKVIVDTSDLN